jgi:hypothetical protein
MLDTLNSHGLSQEELQLASALDDGSDRIPSLDNGKPAAPAAPRWSAQGTPVNAEAAMADALLWLETIVPPRDAENRKRLGACIAALRSRLDNED